MKNPRRILMVEDNPDDEALLLRQLDNAELSRHLKVINDGEVALLYLLNKRSNAEELSAIFLDLHLPNRSGLYLLEAIRNEERICHLPVIAMTASPSPHEVQECRRLGVSGFVRKPLTWAAFAKALADTFHRPTPVVSRYNGVVE